MNDLFKWFSNCVLYISREQMKFLECLQRQPSGKRRARQKREDKQVSFKYPRSTINQDTAAFVSLYVQLLSHIYYLKKKNHELGILIIIEIIHLCVI